MTTEAKAKLLSKVAVEFLAAKYRHKEKDIRDRFNNKNGEAKAKFIADIVGAILNDVLEAPSPIKLGNKTSEKYLSIVAWGQMMGSFSPYINDQVAQAIRDDAPAGATYERDGKWSTLSDITNSRTIEYFRTNHPELYSKFMHTEAV